jgi:FkbM family methyltransferase
MLTLKTRIPYVGRLYRQRDAFRHELAESKHELAESKRELAECRRELAESKHELAESKRGFAEAEQERAESQHELADSRRELAECKQRCVSADAYRVSNNKPPYSRLYVLEGVLLAIPENIISDKFHSDLMSGTYENKELTPIRKNINHDDIVLELGTAIGFISTLVAKLLKNGRVVSYEANPGMVPIAAHNHRLNCVNVDLRHALVTSGAAQREVEFYVDKTFFWDSGIVPRAHDNGSVREKITVKSENFADVLREVDPSILVIDIEGGEVGLFDDVVSLDRVRHIFFELHAFVGPNAIHQLFSRLHELGFAYNKDYSSDYVATFTRLRTH